MDNDKSKQKMFIQIVQELQGIIATEGIKPGEKLPSERTLAERLSVGRSSIREALRSMELLGLIETRHGGGTFLTDFRNHQLVEVLAQFILQGEQDVQNIVYIQRILERDAICEIAINQELRNIPVWDSLLNNLIREGSIEREVLLREIIVSSEKRLVYKIWILLNEYGGRPYKGTSVQREKEVLEKFLSDLKVGNAAHAIQAYDEWLNILS